MTKDSQIDKKSARRAKAKGKTTIATEGQNKNPNAKKQSVKTSPT